MDQNSGAERFVSRLLEFKAAIGPRMEAAVAAADEVVEATNKSE